MFKPRIGLKRLLFGAVVVGAYMHGLIDGWGFRLESPIIEIFAGLYMFAVLFAATGYDAFLLHVARARAPRVKGNL
jgi:hypothetical protein